MQLTSGALSPSAINIPASISTRNECIAVIRSRFSSGVKQCLARQRSQTGRFGCLPKVVPADKRAKVSRASPADNAAHSRHAALHFVLAARATQRESRSPSSPKHDSACAKTAFKRSPHNAAAIRSALPTCNQHTRINNNALLVHNGAQDPLLKQCRIVLCQATNANCMV